MIDILQRLEFTVDVKADGSWDVSAPLYREDVESFPDLAEEVIREMCIRDRPWAGYIGSKIFSGDAAVFGGSVFPADQIGRASCRERV